ncbi:MAG: acetylxylan esterase [Candidatus Omnitrophota bacterium]
MGSKRSVAHHFNSRFAILFVLGLMALPYGAYSEGDVILLDNQSLNAVANLPQAQAGDYAIWAWSKDAVSIDILIGDKIFHIPPKDKAQEGAYSWKNAGTISIEKPQNLFLRVYSNLNGRVLAQKTVGWLAVSKTADWNPERYFDCAKIFPKSDGAVNDRRLKPVRRIEDFYPFPDYGQNREKWLERKQSLNDHIFVSMGAFPQPQKTPLNANIFGRIERDDYTVEKVYFESFPGFYATGNLYRPKGKPGPFPAVLCPHGHWEQGRLVNTDNNSIPGRCINFAKQGYVCFAIDMVGYVDSKQIEHRWGGPAEWLWGLSAHGLQFWNSVRAVDFLESLPDVDRERIACTGASGGGTQTYTLMAVDRRIKAAAPVNMLSAHYQGGCICENAPNLRVAANNVEYGAMMAPRPLMMVSCTGDWTNETLRVEYPAIRSIYALFGAEDKVRTIQIDADHNYNRLSREAVYAAFGDWVLGEKDASKFKEQDFTVEKDDDLRVFSGDLPSNAKNLQQLVDYFKEQSENQLQEVFPDNEFKLQAMRRRFHTSLQHVLSISFPSRSDLSIERVGYVKQSAFDVEKIILGRKGAGDQIPGELFIPKQPSESAQGTVLVHEKGKSAFIDPQTGAPGTLLQSLLDSGQEVFLPDVFMTGEYDSPFQKAVRDENVSMFLTYNQTETALWAQDILTSLAYLDSRFEVEKIHLAGVGDAGLWCLLAAPFAPQLQSVAVDAAKFISGEDEPFLQRLFVPGLRRAGDVRAAQALLAPIPLLIYNTGDVFSMEWAKQSYRAALSPDSLLVMKESAAPEKIASWLNEAK